MARKVAAVITLAAFALVSISCTTLRTRNIREASDLPGKRARIVSVVMRSGERIDFSKADPGRVRGLLIEGTAVARFAVPIEIRGPFSSIRRRANGAVYEITDGSGRVYSVLSVLKEGDTRWSIFINDRTVQQVSLTLSDVRQIRFKHINPTLTFFAIAVPLALGLGYLAITAAFRE